MTWQLDHYGNVINHKPEKPTRREKKIAKLKEDIRVLKTKMMFCDRAEQFLIRVEINEKTDILFELATPPKP